MVLRWLEAVEDVRRRPHDLLSYADVGSSILMMICVLVLSLWGLYAYDPPQPWYIKLSAGACIMSLIVRAFAVVWPEIRRRV